MSATFTKLKNGSWGIRVNGTAKVGQTVTVTKKSGGSSEVTISKVIWTGNGVSICSIEASEPVSAARHGSYATIGQRTQARMDRTKWTGCSCGSIDGNPRPSDCWTCRHDSE